MSALIISTFGLIGYAISNHLISKAKREIPTENKHRAFSDRGHRPPPMHLEGRRHVPPSHHEDEYDDSPEQDPIHRGPVVFGMTPEGVNSLIFAMSLFLGFLCSSCMLILLSRKTAKTAEYVLNSIKQGNLSTRFPVSSIDIKFNSKSIQ